MRACWAAGGGDRCVGRFRDLLRGDFSGAGAGVAPSDVLGGNAQLLPVSGLMSPALSLVGPSFFRF